MTSTRPPCAIDRRRRPRRAAARAAPRAGSGGRSACRAAAPTRRGVYVLRPRDERDHRVLERRRTRRCSSAPSRDSTAARRRQVRRVLARTRRRCRAERAGPLASLVPEERERAARCERGRGALVAVVAARPSATPARRRRVGTRRPAASTSRTAPPRRRRPSRAAPRPSPGSVRARARRDRARGIPSRLPRPRADLERAVAGVQTAELDDRVEQRVGIRRAGTRRTARRPRRTPGVAHVASGVLIAPMLASQSRHAPRKFANSTRPSSPGGGGHHAAPRGVDVVERRTGLAEQTPTHRPRPRRRRSSAPSAERVRSTIRIDARDERRVLHRERDAHRVGARTPVLAQRLAEAPLVEAAPVRIALC